MSAEEAGATTQGSPLPRGRPWPCARSAGGGVVARWPVAGRQTRADDVLATLRADAEVAGWLVPGAGWWPRPRQVDPPAATARWQMRACRACGLRCAGLIAQVELRAGDEITVAFNPAPPFETAAWPLEATFDGGARLIGGDGWPGPGPPSGTTPLRVAPRSALQPPSRQSRGARRHKLPRHWAVDWH